MVAAPPLLRRLPVQLVLLIAILMGFVNHSSAEWLVDTNSNYKKLGEILHSFPHFTFSDGLEDDVQFSTSNSYFQMIALLAVPFAVVAILVLIAGITAACFIGICRCRGGTSPGRRTVVKMLRTFLALAIIGLCGGGIWGSFEIHEAVPYVIDKADDSASLIIGRAEVVYVDAIQVQQYIPNMQELVDLLNTGRSYESDLNDVSDPAKKVELAVFILTLVLYGLIVAVTVLSLFVGFLRFHRTLLGLSFLGWVGLLIIWVVCGIYLAGSVSISDVCETHNQHLLNEVLSSGSLEGNLIQHYVLCNGSSILQEFESDALLLISMANSSLQQAIASGNQTQIEYWSDVLHKSLVLYDDFLILENCTDTYNNVESAKEKTCTDFMLGSFIVMTSQFFIGVLGFFVWILGVEEWRLESIAAGGNEEYVSLNDEDRTPLVEVRQLERQNRRSIFA